MNHSEYIKHLDPFYNQIWQPLVYHDEYGYILFKHFSN